MQDNPWDLQKIVLYSKAPEICKLERKTEIYLFWRSMASQTGQKLAKLFEDCHAHRNTVFNLTQNNGLRSIGD